ncbi:hypothetical protein F4859DRAFT_500870 [Xylaria cf. heliscus]|nr:hypothetical protein F4859DRAFT_500870 [Xylaria cf. heliscus]
MADTMPLQICLVASSSSTLFNDRRLNNIIRVLYSRRAFNSGRQRHRRALSAPSTPSPYYHPSQGQRRRLIGEPSNCRSFERLVRPTIWADMGLERRLSRASPTAPASLDAVLNVSSIDFRPEDKAQATAPIAASPQASGGSEVEEDGSNTAGTTSSSMPPPQSSAASETFDTSSIRSTSPASRNANRLSLTLPIALPNSLPSRPTPTSSMPPTPIDTMAFNSPVDSDEYIVAIAAQERRVLELREELSRAEAELKRLQRQWTISEACKKRPPNTTAPPRSLAPAANLRDGHEDSPAVKRNSELERRKAILLAQSQGTPQRHKRTVFRGGHARTLSLLSPTRSVDDTSIHEDQESIRSPDSFISPPPTSIRHPLNKRATWAPYQSTPQSSGVKQLANDFKQGLWTFVEDLRQATVGDEAVSGTTNRTTEIGLRSNKKEGDQDTIRASTASRGRIPFPTEPDSQSDSPSSSSENVQHRRTVSKPEPRARKHFSWTPLTFDNFNDDDWSHWDTPNVKTSRWSGSTVNGDIVPAIPERADENETALRHKRSKGELESSPSITSTKLEELPQAILNRLTPSKIKSTTSNFIKEWEKSLSPPAQTATFDAGFQDFTRNTQ